MKVRMKCICVFIFAIVLLPAASLLAQSRALKPNDFTIELGGKFLFYSLSYQRMIGKIAAFEISASMIPGSLDGDASWLALSGGARFYFTNKNAAPYFAVGVAYFNFKRFFYLWDWKGVYFYAAPGFEYRALKGFLFRGAVNFLLYPRTEHVGFLVWPGIQLGIAF